jgi:hypothetical protein
MGDVQLQPADTKAEQGVEDKAAASADGVKGKKVEEEQPEEMSFFEKLALKAAKLTGTVAVDAVYQEKAS